MSSNQNIPGLILPTRQAMPAGTPAASAMATMKGNAQFQTNATKALAGGRKWRGGASSSIVIPQPPMLYKPVGGPGTSPNDQAANNLTNLTQSGTAGNSKYDNYATVMGGNRRRRQRLTHRRQRRRHKGGNSDWNWGCMSGGKKSKSKKSRKNRTHKRY